MTKVPLGEPLNKIRPKPFARCRSLSERLAVFESVGDSGTEDSDITATLHIVFYKLILFRKNCSLICRLVVLNGNARPMSSIAYSAAASPFSPQAESEPCQALWTVVGNFRAGDFLK